MLDEYNKKPEKYKISIRKLELHTYSVKKMIKMNFCYTFIKHVQESFEHILQNKWEFYAYLVKYRGSFVHIL